MCKLNFVGGILARFFKQFIKDFKLSHSPVKFGMVKGNLAMRKSKKEDNRKPL